jgi:hypothetical protein
MGKPDLNRQWHWHISTTNEPVLKLKVADSAAADVLPGYNKSYLAVTCLTVKFQYKRHTTKACINGVLFIKF